MSNELIILIFGTTLLLTVLITFILFSYFFYRKKQIINATEKEKLTLRFQQELLRTQLEIQEQTFQTISQEIHDNIGQVLSLVKINISTVDMDFPLSANEKLSDAKKLLTKVIQDLRDLAKSLNTDSIDEIGLDNAIQQQMNLLQKTGNYLTELIVQGELYRLYPQHELFVFRIVQELLNNIVKHAEASSISIIMNYQFKLLEIKVIDNGKGMNNHQNDFLDNTGLGIHNIRNRIKLLKGIVHFSSGENRGTIVTLSLPQL